ncbi:hypothetical protein WJX81_007929 [Elliptochloris bilobata]|uniref:Uncharacterized protein n=1 Tax=Elliptochloris bilobata TaxID=381761 RepID=A0AAW1S288_9CHLO
MMCCKEAFAVNTHQLTPRRALLVALNAATAVGLCCGMRLLLRERRLYNHERLKCYLHLLMLVNSQENILLAGGKELSAVASSPLLLHAMGGGAWLRGDAATYLAADCAGCVLVTGLTLTLAARLEKASRLAFLRVRGLSIDLMPALYRHCTS